MWLQTNSLSLNAARTRRFRHRTNGFALGGLKSFSAVRLSLTALQTFSKARTV